MRYSEAGKRLRGFRKEIAAIREKMREVQSAVEPQEVDDYVFDGADGKVRLSELFADKQDLFVVHNMGRSCPYCTLWADGMNGVYDHLADRAAFVVSTPDTPAAQRRFSESRGWRFPMVSHKGTRFADKMGYGSEGEGWMPGISVFQRRNGKIVRVSDTAFGPGDDFAAIWHVFDLLPGGAGDWSPQYKYPKRKGVR